VSASYEEQLVSQETERYHVTMATHRNRQRSKIAQRSPREESASVVEPSPRTPEDARATAVRLLLEPGRERARLAAELERLDADLRPLVLGAIEAGVPYRRISELSGVSRATVARWGTAGSRES
jgi:hypothetical protein